MTKKALFILLFVPFYSFSQYKTLSIIEKPKEEYVFIYDTLVNIKALRDLKYFSQFIGQELFFYPRNNSNDNNIFFQNFETDSPKIVSSDTIWLKKRGKKTKIKPTDYTVNLKTSYKPIYVENKKVNVCGIPLWEYNFSEEFSYLNSDNIKTGYYTPAYEIEGKTFKIINITLDNKRFFKGILKFTLLNEQRDTLNWFAHYDYDYREYQRPQAYPVMIKALIEKLRSKYLGNEFFYTDGVNSNLDNLNGTWTRYTFVNTIDGEKEKLIINSKLKCLEFRLVGNEKNYLVPSLIFLTEQNKKIVIPISEYPEPFGNSKKYYGLDKWAFLEELTLIPAKIIYEEREKVRIIEENNKILEAKQFEIRKKNLLIKYGKYNTELILQGKVIIGMTKSMCIEAWGEPSDINKTSGSWGVHEQWVYGMSNYLYFENGILTSIQN